MIDKRRALGRKPAMVLTLLALILLLFAGVSYNASKPGQEIEGCPRGCASISPNQDNVLRVMSLNMLHGFPQFEAIQSRLDLIASEILRVEADIVCLQETPWSRQTASAAGYLSKMTALNYVYLRANGNRKVIFFEEGSAILSRYPLIGLTHKELEPVGRYRCVCDTLDKWREADQRRASRCVEGICRRHPPGCQHRGG
jgi:hypothetical protein